VYEEMEVTCDDIMLNNNGVLRNEKYPDAPVAAENTLISCLLGGARK
jgi:hypothetical protein